jgi:NADPH-dependent curcumin reductase
MKDILSAQRIVLANRPTGKPKPEDFRLETVPVPTLAPGDVLLKTLFLSIDPYMRGRMNDAKSYAPPAPIGSLMPGETISRVLKSNDPDFQEGEYVQAYTGWTTLSVMKADALKRVDSKLAPLTASLGIRGMPGLTAYAGLLHIGKPKDGECVVVAAASGPVGSLVGQLARIKGARAVGIAGGAKKCEYVTKELGFDACIDHRDPNFPAQLQSACPTGIDVYFESVGGAVWEAVLPLLNNHGRVPVCGMVSQYNDGEEKPGSISGRTLMRQILTKSLRIQGFLYYDFEYLRNEFYVEVGNWISDGRIKYKEDFVDGLAAAPSALIGLTEGRNFGKMIVRLDADSPSG